MTSALLDRPGTPDAPTAAWSAKYTGTLRLLRLYLRRDRIVAPLWILLLSVPLATVYVGSISKVYPTDADRAGMVASIASPAQRAMYGNVYRQPRRAGVWKAMFPRADRGGGDPDRHPAHPRRRRGRPGCCSTRPRSAVTPA